MAGPSILNLAPLQTPPIVTRPGIAGGPMEFAWSTPWLKYFSLLNSFFNGGGGSGGGAVASVRNLDILGVAQVVDAPVVPSGAGQILIYRLNTAASPASIVWGTNIDPAADTRINPFTGKFTIFTFYSEDRGSGLLWYISTMPYMVP